MDLVSGCLKTCLGMIFKRNGSLPKELAHEYEEEEFINPSAQLGFQVEEKAQFQKPVEGPSRVEEHMKQQLVSKKRLEQQQIYAQEPEIKNLLTDESIENVSDIDYETFSINLDSLDPHYATLSQHSLKLQEYLETVGTPVDLPITGCGLSISACEAKKGIALLLEYRLNCPYSYFVSLMKDSELHTSRLCPLISQSKILESLKSNLTLNSVRFKKFGLLEPRDLVYWKYHNGMRQQHWQLCVNEQSDKHVSGEQSKRCSIFSVSNLRESGQGLRVRQYVCVDIKSSSVFNILPKITLEIRNYLEGLYQYVQLNYIKETV